MTRLKRLCTRNTTAIVSLSSGMLGEVRAIHKLHIAQECWERDYDLRVLVMPNALKGLEYVYEHPEARAKDWMDAFRNPEVKAIFLAIGGDDAVRMLPYIDYDVIRQNPKISTEFSDTTSNHPTMYKAGVISYYGASVMMNLLEHIRTNDYTANAIYNTLFEPKPQLDILSSPYWYDDEDEKIWWKGENMSILKQCHPEELDYETFQGSGVVEGSLLGGCIDMSPMLVGTSIWLDLGEWRNRILFLETSEEDVSPGLLIYIPCNLTAQGIFDVISGILVGKPARRSKYGSYKDVFRRVVGLEVGRPEPPVLCNVNFGYAELIGAFPYGALCRFDADHKTLTLLESATELCLDLIKQRR